MKITMDDVARESGVSKATVSYVLNNRQSTFGISAKTAAKVLDTVKRLNYKVDQAAVLLSERQESFDSVCCRHAGSGVAIACIRTSDKASCLWQQRAKKGLAFTEKRDNLQSVLGILNSKEDMEADSNQ